MKELNRSVGLWAALVGFCLVWPCLIRAQSNTVTAEPNSARTETAQPNVCRASMPGSGGKRALRLVCAGGRVHIAQRAIVIGFVDGFVRHDDKRFPEVQFASFLRESYPSIVQAEVFSNHDGKTCPAARA